MPGLFSFIQALSEEIVEKRIIADALRGDVDVVFKTDKFDLVVVHDDIGRARVAVARLADGSDVDDDFFLADCVSMGISHFIGSFEIGIIDENAGHMGMAAEAGELIHAFEIGEELVWCRVDVIREQVFIDGFSRGAVDEEKTVQLLARVECAEKPPASVAAFGVGFFLETGARPECGALGADVEICLLVEDGMS